MERLSVSFHNFWPGFDPTDNFFYKALSTRYTVECAGSGADLQIHSVFGPPIQSESRSKQRPLRVWYSGESREPSASLYDLYFGFQPHLPLPGWHRLPLWVIYIDWWNEVPSPWLSPASLAEGRPRFPKDLFCNFIYSNPLATRTDLFLRMNRIAKVHSFGGLLNTEGRIGPSIMDKLQILCRSKFTIAYENAVVPGYVTEKLLHPLACGSIPIYYGAPDAKTDFNPRSFIWYSDFASHDDLARYVTSRQNSQAFLEDFLSEPIFRDNKIRYEFTPNYFVDAVAEKIER